MVGGRGRDLQSFATRAVLLDDSILLFDVDRWWTGGGI